MRLLVSLFLLAAFAGAQEWPRLSLGAAGEDALLSDGRGVTLFEKTSELGRSYPLPKGVVRAAFANSGELVWLRGNALEIVDPRSFITLRRADLERVRNPEGVPRLALSDDAVAVCSPIPLGVGNPEPTCKVFGLARLELRSTFVASEMYSGLDDLALTRDARTLVSVSGDGTMRFWDVQQGRERERTYLGTQAYAVALSPDERFVATAYRGAGEGSGVRVWDFASGRVVSDIQGVPGFIVTMAMTKRGAHTLLAAASQGQFKVWSLPTGDLLTEGEVSEGVALAFTPQGALMLGLNGVVTLPVP